MTGLKSRPAAAARSGVEVTLPGKTPHLDKNPVVLIVDDESAILSAMGRTLRKVSCELFTAPSAIAALELMTRQQVDVVISDMRMPRMDGAELLSRVRNTWPHVIRVLITGVSDINTAIYAVNHGGIHFYISKPWDDDGLRSVVEDALNQSRLHHENVRLLALTQTQNAQLSELHEDLQARIDARTDELHSARNGLETRNRSLNESYRATIQLLTNLIEMSPGIQKGVAGEVANLAVSIARMGELPRRECMTVYYAGQLHEIGKLGLPEDVLNVPADPSKEQLGLIRTYPLMGQLALEGSAFLRDVGIVIAAHCEDWDGRGFPNQLSGYDIPQCARILRVARDYFLALQGLAQAAPKHRARYAFQSLHPAIGSLYDAEVMHWLEKVLDRQRRASAMEDESSVVIRQLIPGMVLSRDIVTRHGVTMLTKDHVLTVRNIDQLADLQAMEDHEITAWVYT